MRAYSLQLSGLVSAVLSIAVLSSSVSLFAQSPSFTLAEDGENHWYRGNMHTHSLWSDGDDFPEMIAAWYQQHDYQFLVFTEHNLLLNTERWIDVETQRGGAQAIEKLRKAFPKDWINTRERDGKQEIRLRTFEEIFERLAVPQKFLLIQGEEITDNFQKRPIHLCATNTGQLLIPMGGTSMTETLQQNFDAATAARERNGTKTLIHLNHPNFRFSITAEQMMGIIGQQFFEVYNGHSQVFNSGDTEHASTERIWDIINTWRLGELQLPLIYGLAADDGHTYHISDPGAGSQPGRGWVVVQADTLTPDALVTSLEAGRFYASSGVALNLVSFADNALRVEVKSEGIQQYRIDFIGTRRGFDNTSQPASPDPMIAERLTRIYSSDVGAVLQSSEGPSAVFQCRGDELYVRAVVTSSEKHPNPSENGDLMKAWIQPVIPTSRP